MFDGHPCYMSYFVNSEFEGAAAEASSMWLFFKIYINEKHYAPHKTLKTRPVFSKFLPRDKLSSTNQSIALCHAVPSY